MQRDKVQEAKDLLAKAIEEERMAGIQSQLEELKAAYEGKAFGTHTFERKSKAGYRQLAYYEHFYLNERGEIMVKEWHIYNQKYANSINNLFDGNIQITRNVYNKQLTRPDSQTNAKDNLYCGYSFQRKEIPLQKFMQIWEATDQANTIIEESFASKIPDLQTPQIRQGDYSDEDKIQNRARELRLDLIDVTQFPELFEVVKYKTLPLFDHNRWLPRIYAKAILDQEIQHLQGEIKRSSPYSYERTAAFNNKQIKTIQEFIHNELE